MLQTDIIERNKHEIIESMLGMTNGNELVHHYLPIDNSHPDNEFDDDNTFCVKCLD